MSAPVLLADYKMKKKNTAAKRESETPVTLGFMREFRAEILSRFSGIDARFEQIDARFEQIDARFEQIDAQFKQVDAQFDNVSAQFKQVDSKFAEIGATLNEGLARMDTKFHEAKLLAEEQNLRNRQAYDSYAVTDGALQDLKNRIRPECLED